MPILLTLDTNKVYAGWVVRSPNLRLEDEYLSLLPLASGYRDKETLKTQLNVFYPFHEYWDKPQTLNPREFILVIPYSAVKKANYFDVEVYAKYFASADVPPAMRSSG